MQFIEALKLRSKLLFIFIVITLGLILVGIVGTSNLNTMKKNLDSLYFGSLVPVVELNNILQVYNGSLTTTIYKAKNSEIELNEVKLQIDSAITKINKEWKNYEYHFKRDEEKQYINHAASEILIANNYFLALLKAIEGGKNLKNLSIGTLESKTTRVDRVINKLITYEVDMAKYERKDFLKVYNSMIKNVGFILLMIILGIMLISYYVFKSIQKDQTELEITTKKLKKANKQLENVSYTDALTGLYNRRYFNLVYDRELKRAKRTHNYITFMMLDIDYFKQYNDTYGHIEGDFALKSVAKVLKDTLKRPSDFIFRLGGEEFGVILSETSESDSASIARNICDAVRNREIKHENSKVNEFLTISVGVTCCVADKALDEEILITRADEMLYKAKDGGRDNYCITTNISQATPKKVEPPKVQESEVTA
jgi:diguanylate cyclase (GGDEF)-like protein